MKLKVGDEIRVIAPSRNMEILSDETINTAIKRLEEFGLKVTFGKNVYNSVNDVYGCASVEDRVEDLHEAFLDKNVKAILTVLGGFNVNQMLDYIDYDIIKNNPKIICGFSDITALATAIYVKTGLITYSGPHFSTFGMKYGIDYTIKYFKELLMNDNIVSIESSDEYSDDEWYINQEKRTFIKNDGMYVLKEGIASGTIIGGNLCTLNLLQGTEYMPKEDNIILFIEDDGLVGKEFVREFDRNLQSLIQCLDKNSIKGIVVGRAQLNCEMNIEKWKMIFETKKELENIPIVINADFGHTTPIFTFPIGGKCDLNIKNDDINIRIMR